MSGHVPAINTELYDKASDKHACGKPRCHISHVQQRQYTENAKMYINEAEGCEDTLSRST